MTVERLNELIGKYTSGTASDLEAEELNNWYRAIAYQDAAFPADENETYRTMLSNINRAKRRKILSVNFARWKLAAAVLILFGIGTAIYLSSKQSQPEKGTNAAITNQTSKDAKRAVLILANGKEIYLNEAANGQLATQGNISIAKSANGQLIYKIQGSSGNQQSAKDVVYNTIKTPAGVQYQVILPDQTRVWLNAMSSIKFPVSFDNLTERSIALTGEAYFDVIHNAKLPFKVTTRNLVTQDIGTEFNIKAYPDDADIHTTLVKGSASVTDGKQAAVLYPGQQAAYRTAIRVNQVNTDDVIAWKNGYFRFDGDHLEDVMKAISRWYDVKYVFRDESLKTEAYGFVAAKSNGITFLLNMMEQTGTASFVQKGNTITISKRATK